MGFHFRSCGRRCRLFHGLYGFLALMLVGQGLVLAPGAASAAPTLYVRNDLGGPVETRVAEVRRLRSAGVEVRIIGTCASACTLYLGLPNTCVSPGSTLAFHGPSSDIPGLPLPRREFDRLSSVMASHYPPRISSWFWQEARMVTGGYYAISGAQAIRMGARACT